MSDKVIELFKATDPRQRSTGEVAAPLVENECCKCRTKLMRKKKSDSYVCDQCFELMHEPGGGDKLVEKLATSVERAAVVKRLRDTAAKMRGVPLFGYAMRVLNDEADMIEKGVHCK